MTPLEEFGSALRLLREARNRSQREVGEALGISPAQVSAWERGRGSPSLTRLSQLAELLDLDLGDLDDARAIVRNAPPRTRRAGLLRTDHGEPPCLAQLLLGSPGLLPLSPAEQTLSELLGSLAKLIRQLQQSDAVPPSRPGRHGAGYEAPHQRRRVAGS
jgi:transcriptional regulator with XRE-family HTH domain